MDPTGIPLDKAELLSVLLEALLYGFSLLMFGATIWTLLSSTRKLNRKMITVACALLLCSTVHFVIDIMRVMDGLILYRDTGPIAYFADVSQWTFVAKNYVFTAQTLIGDGVVLYRCYMVWQSKLVMIFPVLLWCSTVATGIGSPYTASRVTQSEVFGGTLSRWITAFWATALATNLLTTLLLVCRIWYVGRKATRLCGNRQSELRPVLHIIVDAGAFYSVTLLVALACFISRSNGQYVVLNMVTPIISITFYMVIIRVGMANQANRSTNVPLAFTSTDDGQGSAERRRRMQVRITTLTESKIDHGQRQPMCPASATSSKTSPVKTNPDGGGSEV
ncbi:hypothetical protein EV363DRAFT_1584542 [Boletus edulis]|uniref:Uncharacterized protein n=1 Tax=Boletus edulis BED1 TaxID=1328754 RepID=A0AAD4BQA6_BOLED|nr:hypothetical protein EV363DRAFT_1584542 [Boletus edulis]KAF8436525.1 hypothetical protein L210DRAFT_3548262 [Boletus edulis BED1]